MAIRCRLLRCRRFVFPVITLAVVVGIPTLPGSAATATAGPGATGNSAFGKMVNTMEANVDAVAPGHTMLGPGVRDALAKTLPPADSGRVTETLPKFSRGIHPLPVG